MFFADLALRQDDFGSILPEYSAVIFDEAHEIEDVASDYFGRQVSNYRFEELARDAEQAMRLTQLGQAAAAAPGDPAAGKGARVFRVIASAGRAAPRLSRARAPLFWNDTRRLTTELEAA